MQFRDLHRQYLAMKEEIDEAISTVVVSGSFIMGSVVETLEKELADYVGVKHCITCANGTDAMLLALTAWEIGPGDAVFLPDFTFFATAEVVARVGATPVFVDVEEHTFNIDPSDLYLKFASVVSQGRLRPAAVIAVDLFGRPAPFPLLSAFCKEHGMRLLEDGAQGFGGRVGEKRACSFGDISTTSFFPAKPLGCYGDGGAIFTDSDEWAAVLRSLRLHGKGSDKYDNVRIGFNSRLDALQAAILRVKLRHFDDELQAVGRVASRYNELLKNKVAIPQIDADMLSSWAQYTVRSDNRDLLRSRLQAKGIPSMVYYPRPMSRQTAFATLGQSVCPVADQEDLYGDT